MYTSSTPFGNLFRFACGLCLLAILLGTTSCKNRSPKEKPSAEPAIAADLMARFNEDAHRLAAREYNSTTRNNDPQVQLPAERVHFFMDLLKKTYLLTQQNPEIPDLSHIHTFPVPALKRVMVILEKDAPFAETWLSGRRTTSNMYLNQVMSENRLTVKDCREGALGTTCIVEAAGYVNTKDLAFILQHIDGIKVAEPDGVAGDGNNIEYGSEGKNHTALKFSVGEGDCPSGCIYRKYWIFYVQQDGSINYMGTRGELPDGGGSEEK